MRSILLLGAQRAFPMPVLAAMLVAWASPNLEVDQPLRAFAESWTAALRTGRCESRDALLHRASMDCPRTLAGAFAVDVYRPLSRSRPRSVSLTLAPVENTKPPRGRGGAPVYLFTIFARRETLTSQVGLFIALDGKPSWREFVERPGARGSTWRGEDEGARPCRETDEGAVARVAR